VTLPKSQYPSITFIGSSNYTKRSHNLDLEMNALVITNDERLQRDLSDEIGWLRGQTTPLKLADFEKEDRKVGWGVKLALWFVGGAL